MAGLPLTLMVEGRPVILIGEGPVAEARRRLVERAGGWIVGEDDDVARLAFVVDDEPAAVRLRARGVLVNLADRPELCDFQVPAIVTRDPLSIAVATGGASAGLAKAVRQRIEAMLPATLGALVDALQAARPRIAARWPEAADRRRALDAALAEGGPLDPMAEHGADAVETWLGAPQAAVTTGLVTFDIASDDPEELTLRAARLLGQADRIYHDPGIAPAILARARADAARIAAPPPADPPAGLSLHLRTVP